jgi:eukaryotic-like serine/threonine-protein kinase
MTAQLGRVLGGRYRLVAPLGSGASAQVYLAEDVTLERRVAVKILHPAFAGDEAFLRRFGAEARAAAALSHPNVMAVYDWGDDEGPYLVLEYLAGGSLRAMLDTGVRLSTAQTLMVGLQAAHALDVAHRRGFVHRDVKPANLVFGDEGRLRIADFGLTRALAEAAWTEPGAGLVGTARYAAPEQAASSRVDGKADVYALGLVLIEALTGAVPLTADTNLGTLMCRVDTQVPVPEAMGPLREILERCGRPDPADRPEASDLIRSFLQVARQLDPPDPLPLAGAVEPAALAAMAETDPTLHAPGSLGPPVADGGADERTVVLAGGPAVAGADGSTTVRMDPVAPAADDTGVVEEPPAEGLATSSDPRRRRWPRVLALVVLLLALAGGAAYAFLESRPVRAAVPDLATLTEDEARAALASAQAEAGEPLAWEVEFVREFSERVSEGVVIRQDPTPGTQLVDGGSASVVISEGPPFVTVPMLTDRVDEQAKEDIEAAGLVVGNVTARHDEVVPPGEVLDWQVGDEVRPAEARKGAAVDVWVSSGPAPRTVPELAGTTVDEARQQLEALQLEVAVVEEYSSSVDRGRVIATDPGADASVDRGEPVTVRVSQGPEPVSIPDIIRERLEEAVARLRSVGLSAGNVSGRASGVVGRTDPPVGSRVQPGTEVDIELS